MVLATSATIPGELVQVDGAELLMLEPLDEDSAHAILTEMGGVARLAADTAAADALIRLCGGLPLALRVVGARLAQEPTLTVRELLNEIDEDGLLGDGPGSVDAVLTAAYEGLSEDAQRTYRLLGAAQAPTFTVQMVSALLEVTPSHARAALRTLSRMNLLTGLPGRRYRFLDLVRRHAVSRAAKETRLSVDAALDRLLDFS